MEVNVCGVATVGEVSREDDGWSVPIEVDFGRESLTFWVDVWENRHGDLEVDWNQFIFNRWGYDTVREFLQSNHEFTVGVVDLALDAVEDRRG